MYEPKTKNPHVEDRARYDAIYSESVNEPERFWQEQSEHLDWFHKPHRVMDFDFDAVDFSWFAGGRLNACHNCVDRHAARTPDRTAIVWAKDEPGEYERISYRELKHQVAKFANVLKAHGVRKGDRVAIYMPMIPQTAYAMLACARIGAVHSVVFAGFSAEALRDRIVDAGCRVVLTANEGLRGGKTIPLKATVDEAVEGMESVRSVIVARRTEHEPSMKPGRDVWLDQEMQKHRSTCPVEWMASEDPLFVLYTSGSTGQPKGVLHTTAGYLTYTTYTHRTLFGLRDNDVYFCAADVGWITGHSYIVYGPLANGATTCMFESVPTYPDAGRYWQIVDDLGVSIFYTAPTAIRAIARAGDEVVQQYSRKTLRVLGTVGEPINPEVWKWYYDVVGGGQCDIVDTWWQTETGGCMISPIAGVTAAEPGSATLPLPGIQPVLLDDQGNELEGNGVEGNLCIRAPWPGQARTVYGDHQR
ncbi:MAG: acetate--CoA ligase, partial [Myxococcota bacterium]